MARDVVRALHTLLACTLALPAFAQERTLEFSVDPRIELLAAVQLISDYEQRTDLITDLEFPYRSLAAEVGAASVGSRCVADQLMRRRICEGDSGAAGSRLWQVWSHAIIMIASVALGKGECGMAQVLVRNLDRAVVERLKRRARRHGRSLQAELHAILERAVRTDIADARRAAERIRRKLADRSHTDSVELLGEDRAR